MPLTAPTRRPTALEMTHIVGMRIRMAYWHRPSPAEIRTISIYHLAQAHGVARPSIMRIVTHVARRQRTGARLTA
jgi:hypothetical protein